jgi:toxin ParE1/3/4
LRFIAALQSAIRHVAVHPGSGSPRYALELNLPGLRLWRLKRSTRHTSTWHGARDLPSWLQGPEESV